jgi:hypothetical protein
VVYSTVQSSHLSRKLPCIEASLILTTLLSRMCQSVHRINTHCNGFLKYSAGAMVYNYRLLDGLSKSQLESGTTEFSVLSFNGIYARFKYCLIAFSK